MKSHHQIRESEWVKQTQSDWHIGWMWLPWTHWWGWRWWYKAGPPMPGCQSGRWVRSSYTCSCIWSWATWSCRWSPPRRSDTTQWCSRTWRRTWSPWALCTWGGRSPVVGMAAGAGEGRRSCSWRVPKLRGCPGSLGRTERLRPPQPTGNTAERWPSS